jgi:hypothetical protein
VEGVKLAAQIAFVLFLGCDLACAQIDLDGYEFDWSTEQLVLVVHENFMVSVKCGKLSSANAGFRFLKVLSNDKEQGRYSSKILATESDKPGVFRFLWVPQGNWRVLVRARCGGVERHAEQQLRVRRVALKHADTRDIVVDLEESRLTVISHPGKVCCYW